MVVVEVEIGVDLFVTSVSADVVTLLEGVDVLTFDMVVVEVEIVVDSFVASVSVVVSEVGSVGSEVVVLEVKLPCSE